MKRLKSLILLLAGFLFVFPARADWNPGPPEGAVIGVVFLALVVGYFGCALFALIFKLIVEQFTKRKRRHIWFQTTLMFLFLVLVIYLENSQNLLYHYEVEHGYEARAQLYLRLILLSLALGCILGYLITPKKKSE